MSDRAPNDETVIATHITEATSVWMCRGERNITDMPTERPKALASTGRDTVASAVLTDSSVVIPCAR
jgi:hypothetical protein